jgi:cellobiose phosphorylase
MDVASTQYLLGLRPTLKGLLIDPCIPREWKEFRVRRRWRGCQLDIHVVNTSGTGKGFRTLEIDGAATKADAPVGLITPEMLVGRPQAEVRVVL